jgi:MscS family membrane protein
LPILRLFRSLLIALALCAAPAAHAQLTPAAPSTPAAPTDPYGRETPRSAVAGLIQALAGRDYERAAHYMAVRMDNPRLVNGSEELARRLQVLLDKGGTLRAFGALSNDPVGVLNDDLPFDREVVGTMRVGDNKVPVTLARSQQGNVVVWRVAPETLQVLAATSVPRDEPAASTTPDGWIIGGAPVSDWMLLFGLAAISFALFRVLAALILLAVRKAIPQCQTSPVYRFLQAALPPLSLFLSIMIFFIWANRLPVAIVARQTLLRYGGTVALVALVWFALRLIDAIAEVATRRLRHHQRRQVISVVNLLRRAAKLLLLAFTVVGVLDTFGINVTTGIAALGIGGIALALGAQKTVENLVGSVTVIADQPVQVGDFCKVGDVSGTVEDVGIRSTRIRTNDRTLVTIPNGDFAARQIENFATRDRFLFNPTIGVGYGLNAQKMREAVDIVRDTLLSHDMILNDGVRATFTNFGENALTIDVWAYLAGPDYNKAMEARQEILLTIMERFEAAGIAIALPTRSVVVQGGFPGVEQPTE